MPAPNDALLPGNVVVETSFPRRELGEAPIEAILCCWIVTDVSRMDL